MSPIPQAKLFHDGYVIWIVGVKQGQTSIHLFSVHNLEQAQLHDVIWQLPLLVDYCSKLHFIFLKCCRIPCICCCVGYIQIPKNYFWFTAKSISSLGLATPAGQVPTAKLIDLDSTHEALPSPRTSQLLPKVGWMSIYLMQIKYLKFFMCFYGYILPLTFLLFEDDCIPWQLLYLFCSFSLDLFPVSFQLFML